VINCRFRVGDPLRELPLSDSYASQCLDDSVTIESIHPFIPPILPHCIAPMTQQRDNTNTVAVLVL